MAEPLRLAVLGLVCEHIWETVAELTRQKDVQIVGAADPNPQALERFRQLTGCPSDRLFQQADRLLDAVPMDGLISGVLAHETVALAELCAQRNLPFYVDFPVASRLDTVDQIVAAVQRSGVRCMVNEPDLWRPIFREALVQAVGHTVGELRRLTVRRSRFRPDESTDELSQHLRWLLNAQLNPTGALLDSSPAAILLALAWDGSPEGVFATTAHLFRLPTSVPDYGILILRYSRGVALIEASWTLDSEKTEDELALIGSKGSWQWPPRPETPAPEPQTHSDEEGWLPPSDHRSGPEHFCWALREDRPVARIFQVETARAVHEVLEAAARSAETGMEFPLPLR